ncbi:MAG: DUF6091 family protein [Alcanivoracaceae bacterium]|nr:DUF6091 family protein [Alcanivoracaceae bacterium]
MSRDSYRHHVDVAIHDETPQYSRAETQQDPAGFADKNATHQVCVFDPVGMSGMQFTMMQAWQRTALDEGGVRPALTLYGSAQSALADFNAEACQAIWLPSELAEGLVPAATLEAFGGAPTLKHGNVLAQVLSTPTPIVERWNSNDDHGLMGVVFSGPAYLIFNKPLNADSLPALLVGRRLATVNKAQAYFASALGATPVPADADIVGTKFNNGTVDAMFATLSMMATLELDRGLQPDGVVLAVPMYQGSYQLIAHKDAFTDEQWQWSLQYFYSDVKPQMEKIAAQEQEWLASFNLIYPDVGDAPSRENLLQKIRLELREKGIYDAEILTLMRKVRCKLDQGRRECVTPVE